MHGKPPATPCFIPPALTSLSLAPEPTQTCHETLKLVVLPILAQRAMPWRQHKFMSRVNLMVSGPACRHRAFAI